MEAAYKQFVKLSYKIEALNMVNLTFMYSGKVIFKEPLKAQMKSTYLI